jgi:hypothetical protein
MLLRCLPLKVDGKDTAVAFALLAAPNDGRGDEFWKSRNHGESG